MPTREHFAEKKYHLRSEKYHFHNFFKPPILVNFERKKTISIFYSFKALFEKLGCRRAL